LLSPASPNPPPSRSKETGARREGVHATQSEHAVGQEVIEPPRKSKSQHDVTTKTPALSPEGDTDNDKPITSCSDKTVSTPKGVDSNNESSVKPTKLDESSKKTDPTPAAYGVEIIGAAVPETQALRKTKSTSEVAQSSTDVKDLTSALNVKRLRSVSNLSSANLYGHTRSVYHNRHNQLEQLHSKENVPSQACIDVNLVVGRVQVADVTSPLDTNGNLKSLSDLTKAEFPAGIKNTPEQAKRAPESTTQSSTSADVPQTTPIEDDAATKSNLIKSVKSQVPPAVCNDKSTEEQAGSCISETSPTSIQTPAIGESLTTFEGKVHLEATNNTTTTEKVINDGIMTENGCPPKNFATTENSVDSEHSQTAIQEADLETCSDVDGQEDCKTNTVVQGDFFFLY